MSKKQINEYAPWAIVGLALLAIVFNTGVTYGHIQDLSDTVAEISKDVAEMKIGVEGLKIVVGRLGTDFKELRQDQPVSTGKLR